MVTCPYQRSPDGLLGNQQTVPNHLIRSLIWYRDLVDQSHVVWVLGIWKCDMLQGPGWICPICNREIQMIIMNKQFIKSGFLYHKCFSIIKMAHPVFALLFSMHMQIYQKFLIMLMMKWTKKRRRKNGEAEQNFNTIILELGLMAVGRR